MVEPGNAVKGYGDFFTMVVDTTGKQLWTKELGSPGNDMFFGRNSQIVDNKGFHYWLGATEGKVTPDDTLYNLWPTGHRDCQIRQVRIEALDKALRHSCV